MKYKVAILTLDGLYNYGNRLQNLAVHKLYEKFECECTTLICDGEILKNKIKLLRALFVDFIHGTNKTIKFKRFNEKYLNVRTVYGKGYKMPCSISREYDFFSVGSDQVWNPFIRKQEKYNYFLRFCNKNQRIALAPSIAVDTIPDDVMPLYVEGVNGFEYLSVREKKGIELLSTITDIDVEVLVDPTLAMSSNEWDDIFDINEKSNNKGKYLLLYFLGEMKPELHDRIKELAEKHNLEIKSLYVKNGMKMYNSFDPKDFVKLIRNATFVFTDSFHGTAFSINYNIPFYTFCRYDSEIALPKMESRITSILEMTNLEERLQYSIPHELTIPDFEYANEILQKERQKVIDYVDKCLKQKEK